MEKEFISQKQGTVLMITFLLGSTLVLGAGSTAKQDSWIAILLSMVFVCPFFFIYGRLCVLYPEKDLCVIFEDIYGKIAGKGFILLYIWYAFHLGALVTRNFIEFITIVSLPETPKFIVGLCMSLVCIWGVKSGVEVLGRWTSIVLPLLILTLTIVTLFAIPLIKPDNLKPVLGQGIMPVLKSSFSVFSFPFAETVLMIPILGCMRKKGNPYKVWFLSLLISGMIIIIISVRSVAILGVPTVTATYFSSYATVSLIDVGHFIQRIEITVSIAFMFAGFVKVCICLYAVCKGFTHLVKINDYKWMVAPLGLFMFIFSLTVFDNTVEMFNWAEMIYPYYALPFQIVLPVATWVMAEVKHHRKNKSQTLLKE